MTDDFNAEEEITRGEDTNRLDRGSLEDEVRLLDIRLELSCGLVDVSGKVICLDLEDDSIGIFKEEEEGSEDILEDAFDVGFDEGLEIDIDDDVVVDVFVVEDEDADFDLALDEVLDVVFVK